MDSEVANGCPERRGRWRGLPWPPGFLAVGDGGCGGDGAAGSVGEAGHGQVDGCLAAGGELVHLSEFRGRCGEADLEPLGFTEPAFTLGLGDAVAQVVADADQAGPLRRVRPQEGQRRQLCSWMQLVP